jgi:GNAT superfamily N-acetyltransferase
MRTIAIANTDADILATYPVMKQLRPHLQESEYVQRIREQQAEGYQLAAVQDERKIVCAAGFRILRSLSAGRHLYVDDLVTDEHGRSGGYGKTMLDWLVDYARGQDCGELHLDSGVHRTEAHRFYFRERMSIVHFHFRRKV